MVCKEAEERTWDLHPMKRLNVATQGEITLLNLDVDSYTFSESRMPAVYMNIDVLILM